MICWSVSSVVNKSNWAFSTRFLIINSQGVTPKIDLKILEK